MWARIWHILLLLLAFMARDIIGYPNGLYAQPLTKIAVMSQGTIQIGSQMFQVIYFDNPTARSLVAQMPFTVELEDYAGTEKIFYPKQALSRDGAPDGADPSKGDLMLYAPWGNVALFYKDFRYSHGLVPFGRVEDVDGLVRAVGLNGPQATFAID